MVKPKGFGDQACGFAVGQGKYFKVFLVSDETVAKHMAIMRQKSLTKLLA